jgi:hypothetical protein
MDRRRFEVATVALAVPATPARAFRPWPGEVRLGDSWHSRHSGGEGVIMTYRHGIVWLDHYRALVITFSEKDHREIEIASKVEDTQLHRKSGKPGPGKQPDDLEFFGHVAVELESVPEILVTGPGTARIAFEKYLHEHYPTVFANVRAVEALDHPSPGELLAYARKRFKRIDQLLGLV